MSRNHGMKSEQIMPNMSMAIDYDEPLKKKEEILGAFCSALGKNCYIEKYNKTKNVYRYEHDGITEYFLAGAITYLSKPHPIFKKRYQLKQWFKEFYNDHKNDKNTVIRLIGIYHYKGLIVFADFKIQDYIHRKLNSSSAHIYSNDIYQAVCNGVFQKTDKNDNHVTSILSRSFKDYINGNVINNSIFELFRKFNLNFSFDKWITAVNAISEMKNKSWYQWKGTEWPGWFLEYKLSSFIEEEHCEDQMYYIGNLKNSSILDFDIMFKKDNFYGDLKASDITKREAPGNDQESVLEAITKYGKLWYIIYEHETVKDKDKDNEMAKARMELIGTPYVEGNKISYANRMKHSVNFKRMRIYELNRINMNEALSLFNQGHQPNGSARKPKFLINKSNIDNCIVYSYESKKV